MMYAYFLTAVFSISTANLATGATLYGRQTPHSCSSFQSGHLAVRPFDDPKKGAPVYVGIVDGVKHKGIDGHSDSLLVTSDDKGNPLQPQHWEFARCTDLDQHSVPPGYTPPSSGPTNDYFGILRPINATQHCLALESKNDNSDGARNSVLDSYCTEVPIEYRTWMFEDYIYGDSADGQSIYFADQNVTVVISNTAHKELQFITNDANSSEDRQQLVLIP